MKKTNLSKSENKSWRDILRSTGSTMLWTMILLVLGGMYLAVSAKAAKVGRRVLNLESQHNQLQLEYDELNAVYAQRTSPDRMRALALSMGFRDAVPADVDYIPIEEFDSLGEFIVPAPGSLRQSGNPGLSPAYSETLVDAVRRWFEAGVDE